MKRLIVPLSLVLACTLNTTLRSEDHPPKKDATREGPIRNFEELDQYVQQIAAREYRTCPPLPEDIDHLSYDEYRMIAFRPEQAIWWNEAPSFWFEMFHRGFVHRNKVSINIATESVEARIPFATKYFEYRGPLAEANIPPDTGFAGLKIVGNFPGHDDGQEMLTFLGASYFRARTADTVYGTSARGLAINAATSGSEEFPAFREFWVVKPKKKQTTLTVLALLESESVTGAYQFELDPGKSRTTLHVQSRLYFRKRPEKIGLAPLTSMWIWGDGLIGPPKDSRPAVHDADGLLILNGEQQWTWRALSRQSYPSLSRIACNDLRGFGLMQRDTDYRHYQDDEAMYHRRPSTWIEPQGSWGAGAVELLELNGAHEGIDNIAAFWVPDEPLPMGQPIDLNYKVHLFRGNLPEHDFWGRAV